MAPAERAPPERAAYPFDPRWGRLGRSWTGTKAYKAPLAGTLTEWHWRALAKAYAAGDAGLERLAHFKAPHTVTFATELPKTATGKIQKYVLSGGRSVIAAQ